MWSDDQVRCLHFIFKDKPWDARNPVVPGPFDAVNVLWWDDFDAMVEGLDSKSRAEVVSLVDTAKSE